MRWSQIIALLLALLSNNEAEAQAKLPTIGFMGQSTASAEALRATAFVQRLRELGWIEGQNIALEFRWAGGRSERGAEIASEFVRLKVDVIATVAHHKCLRRSRRRRASPVRYRLLSSQYR